MVISAVYTAVSSDRNTESVLADMSDDRLDDTQEKVKRQQVQE